MGHLREVADRRDAAFGHGHLEHADRGCRHAQQPGRARLDVTAKATGLRGRAEDRHVARVRDGRRDRPEADPLHDAEPVRQLDDGSGERLPSIVRLRAGQDEQVPLRKRDTPDDELRPGQLGKSAVDDLQSRAPGAVVEQGIRVERRNVDCVIEEPFEGRRGRAAGVHPAVERSHERRGDEVAGVARAARPCQRIEAHARKSTRRPGRPMGPGWAGVRPPRCAARPHGRVSVSRVLEPKRETRPSWARIRDCRARPWAERASSLGLGRKTRQ